MCSQPLAGQSARLLHPIDELRFVELAFTDIEVAHFLVLGFAGRHRTQRRAAEKSHLHVVREAVIGDEPTLALESVERRIPFDCFVHVRNGARDQHVEAARDIPLPARDGCDVGLHGSVAVALRDLRVVAREQHRLRLLAGWRLPCRLARLRLLLRFHFADLFTATAARMRAFRASASISSPSLKSMARRVLPSRLELKSFAGSFTAAPLAKVNFTALLYVSPVQMIPSCDHTGTFHFHSSTTSGSACLMTARRRASVLPRQPSSSLIRASISFDGESPWVLLLFIRVAAP